MERVNLKSVVWKEGKHYVAQCLDVDVSSFGDTRKEALANLQEALELFYEGENVEPVAQVEQSQFVSVSVPAA